MLRRPLTNDFNSRRLPSKRSLQSLLTPEQMNIAIQRESARADRNGGEFALVLFRAKCRTALTLDRPSCEDGAAPRATTTILAGTTNNISPRCCPILRPQVHGVLRIRSA